MYSTERSQKREESGEMLAAMLVRAVDRSQSSSCVCPSLAVEGGLDGEMDTV